MQTPYFDVVISDFDMILQCLMVHALFLPLNLFYLSVGHLLHQLTQQTTEVEAHAKGRMVRREH